MIRWVGRGGCAGRVARLTCLTRLHLCTCAALLASPTIAAAQPAVFAEGVAELRVAIEGTYGDEGPHITAALDKMAAALGEWNRTSATRSLPAGAADTSVLPFAAYAQAYAYLARGEYRDAVEEFRNAAARDPLVTDPAGRSDTMRGAASALRQGRAADAHALLAGSALLQESSEAHRVLGFAYWADARDSESIEHLRSAIRLNARDERSRLALSRVLSSAGRDEEAQRVLQDTIAAIPDSIQPHWWLGLAYEQENRFADARREFERAADGAVGGRAPIYAAIGRLATQAADFPGALDAFTRAVAASPDDRVLRKSLASALLQQDRVAEAFDQLNAALRIDPADAGAHLGIGQIHLNAGRYDDAARALRRAIELSPNYVEARYALATALRRLGRTQEAEQEFTRFEQAQREALANRRRTMIRDVQKEEAALRAAEQASQEGRSTETPAR